MKSLLPNNFAFGSTRTAGRQTGRGFTLIELMITVAIVAILAAVAYPSYQNYIRKSKRATAQAALMDIAAKEQAYLLDRRKYSDTATWAADIQFSTPQEISNAYTFSVVSDNAASPMSFVATATPINAQNTQGEQPLTLNQLGARTPTASGYWGN